MILKDRLNYFVKERRWDELRTFVAEAFDKNIATVDFTIETIFVLLDILLYGKWESQEEVNEIEKLLRDLFFRAQQQYHDNADYLFFVGYFVALAEWAFGQDDLKLSHEMLRRAAEIDPENLLYLWGYRFSTGDPSARSITEKLASNNDEIQRLLSMGEAGKFIAEAIETAYERYRKI